ncbi:glycosyltransferase family 1 protein [Aureimonas fodinaquatilis]|uniref:Glycosyltransferase family 1 protein n=1 Tax=Aureimonas fodinaquatilis TaxID=2565783 RepID=A0A5B0DVL6_9HYPH|nr:glycosyltransferase family 1 protein [Aureimonas fodinaquatilis]KAA0970388.1 glycosyltransferase family 1 protein [Aureimonas fodinaquatilis]
MLSKNLVNIPQELNFLKNLLYLSPVPWASFAQRPHKFVSWFQSHYQGKVFWIEPYATRLPSLADLRRFQKAKRSLGVTPCPEWLTICSPSSLPVEPLPGSGWLNRRLWKSSLTDAAEFAGDGECVIVVGKPSRLALQIMERLPELRSIYDAMDDFPAFYTGLSHAAMKRSEEAVASRADEVWTSSSFLQNRWKTKHSNVRLIFNGLDSDVIRNVAIAPSSSDQKIFGYIGTVGQWFDWEMVVALARSSPGDLIHIIGPVYKLPPKDLPGNIRMFPACEHERALTEMAHFDVGLIPFLKNELTRSVDPIKFAMAGRDEPNGR